jgi:uncharacterized protein (DUF2147 family)
MRPVLALVGVLSLFAGEARASAAFFGVWRTPVNGGGIVRVEACGDRVCGYVVSSPHLETHPDQRDVRNSDPALRARRIMGLQILDARAVADDELGDGWVYDPEEGSTYSGSVTLLKDGRLRLRGCIIWPLCRSQIWTRISK